ncbi:slyX domain-containing protein [Metarhizium brunneum]
MRNTAFGVISSRIRAEKALKYLGTAQIELDVLAFPNSDGPDTKNIERLRKLFRLQRDFKPGELQNRIPAVIDESRLHDALTASGLSLEALLSTDQGYPKLNFPPGFQLECLRGEDRVEAIKGLFRSSSPRWVVDLFAADMSIEAKRDIEEEYASERKLDDGEIYYKIRKYQGIFGQEDPYFEQRWWARIATLPDAKTKKSCLDQLIAHRKFSRAFDAFHHIPALYSGLRLSVVGKMISTRCHEELLAYLRHIKAFWYYIFDGNETAMERLDRESVLALEHKAPGACQKEARQLYGQICSGDILGPFSDMEREQIWSRLCSTTTESLIPSLQGFFENLKYIKLAADCMKRLVRLEGKDTIRHALENAYLDGDQSSEECLVQVSGPAMKLVRVSGIDNFDVLYRQLWLYAIREHADMPAEVKRKKSGANTAQADEAVLFQFASLAHKLGFRSDEIDDILRRNPDREIARRLLRTARKPTLFQYEDIESCITMVEGVIARAQPVPNDHTENEYMIEDDSKPPERSGPPAVTDMARDKRFMYLDVLHGALPRQDPNLTSLFIQRSTYFAFFGQDIGLSIENINAAQNVQGAVDGSLQLERNPNHHSTHSGALQAESELHVAEEVHQRRLEDLRRKVVDAESHLELLERKQNERQNTIEQLQSTITAKENSLEAHRREEDELQERLRGLRGTEAEQIIRLESLQNDVQERQSQISELDRRRTDLGEEIRLDLLSADRQNQSAQEEDQRIRLLQLSDQAIEKQNSINQLAALHRQKQQETQQLDGERERLQSVVDELTVKKRLLSEEEQAKAAALAEAERERKSVVDRLSAKELELRRNIDFLETCLQQLQRKINDATEDEKELRLRIERLRATENSVADGDGEQGLHRVALGTLVRRALNADEGSGDFDTPDESPAGPSAAGAGGSMIQRAKPASLDGMLEEVAIQFKLFEDGDWRVKHEVTVDPREPSEMMWKKRVRSPKTKLSEPAEQENAQRQLSEEDKETIKQFTALWTRTWDAIEAIHDDYASSH